MVESHKATAEACQGGCSLSFHGKDGENHLGSCSRCLAWNPKDTAPLLLFLSTHYSGPKRPLGMKPHAAGCAYSITQSPETGERVRRLWSLPRQPGFHCHGVFSLSLSTAGSHLWVKTPWRWNDPSTEVVWDLPKTQIFILQFII